MPHFIFEANIAHYKERLTLETDPKVIATLHRLLAEEETKLADYHVRKSKSSRVIPPAVGYLLAEEELKRKED